MAAPLPVTVLTYTPSPYQVELFNQVQRDGVVTLQVLYLVSRDAERQWNPASIQHEYVSLDDHSEQLARARERVEGAGLFVANFYQHPFAADLLRARVRSGRPWCFWGERPGYTRWAFLGRYYRRMSLAALHRSRAAIWGIGDWALEQYRAEFGPRRAYFNVPYFSDLSRFTAAGVTRPAPGANRRFLFSGSLIPRKGVDLVAQAFRQLASEFPGVSLTIMGTGELESSLRAQLAPCGDRVRFIGFQQWDQLARFYAEADVVVVPSRHDGWALVVPEGLASGAPVIGSDRMGAAREFIRSGENGWLVEAGDLESLVAALRNAATLPAAELARLSAAARTSVARHTLADGARRFVEAVQGSLASFRN